METRNLASSGLRVSLVGLGCNNFGGRLELNATRAVVHAALDQGITLFDTADYYGNLGGSETLLGETLGARRQDIVLATKFGLAMGPGDGRKGASRRYIMTAVEGSLRRLKTDWIDLYQLHERDPLVPIEETLRALDDLVHQGKVRYIGCSNLPAWQVVDARWTAERANLDRFVSCQDHYSLLTRGVEKELMPAMRAHGLGLLPYFPLASGMLTGKYRRNAALPGGARLTNNEGLANRYLTERNWQIVEQLDAFCRKRDRTMIQLAFSWLAAQAPVSSVIAGASTPEQVAQNVQAAGWKLSPEELAEIDRLTA